MKERPIPFTDPMARAIIEGRKTMTRRVIKPQPIRPVDRNYMLHWENTKAWGFPPRTIFETKDEGILENEIAQSGLCPYGQPGDRLRFLCTWATEAKHNSVKPSLLPHDAKIWTLFDGEKPEGFGKNRPGRFAPKWMRYHFPEAEVTAVRVERVQDISEEDAVSEGVMDWAGWPINLAHKYCCTAGFMQLWDSINAKRGYGWDVNPWVWVIEFKRVTR